MQPCPRCGNFGQPGNFCGQCGAQLPTVTRPNIWPRVIAAVASLAVVAAIGGAGLQWVKGRTARSHAATFMAAVKSGVEAEMCAAAHRYVCVDDYKRVTEKTGAINNFELAGITWVGFLEYEVTYNYTGTKGNGQLVVSVNADPKVYSFDAK